MWGRLNREKEVGEMEVKAREVLEMAVRELEVKVLEMAVRELEVKATKEVGGRVDGKPTGRNSRSR